MFLAFIRSSGIVTNAHRYSGVLPGALALTLVVALNCLGTASAHEGHDPGEEKPAGVAAARPRVALQSDTYELVGILRRDRLTIHLDRFATNEPVRDARLGVTVGDAAQPVQARIEPDGTYTFSSQAFLPGPADKAVELVFAVAAAEGDDLLIGSLRVPAGSAAAGMASARGSGLQVSGTSLEGLASTRIFLAGAQSPYMLSGGALVLGLCLGLAIRGRSRLGRLVPATALVVIALLATVGFARAHEGEEHGPDKPLAAGPVAGPAAASGAIGGDAPQRLSDETYPSGEGRLADRG